jgi:hypothetical protein
MYIYIHIHIYINLIHLVVFFFSSLEKISKYRKFEKELAFFFLKNIKEIEIELLFYLYLSSCICLCVCVGESLLNSCFQNLNIYKLFHQIKIKKLCNLELLLILIVAAAVGALLIKLLLLLLEIKLTFS